MNKNFTYFDSNFQYDNKKICLKQCFTFASISRNIFKFDKVQNPKGWKMAGKLIKIQKTAGKFMKIKNVQEKLSNFEKMGNKVFRIEKMSGKIQKLHDNR